MQVGKSIYNELVKLEKKMWNREDYSEEDITLFSDAMDYIENNKKDFIEFYKKGGDNAKLGNKRY